MNDGQAAGDSPVIAKRHGSVGLITLNRPASLNALDLDMVRRLSSALTAWASDASVVAVVIRGAGRPGKAPAFCAGGDIRFQHRSALAQDPILDTFFDEEYALNHLIHRYPKPYVALMDGIVMGGGMGISQRASLRIVTEHSVLAMPETKIGLFPDVGGGWFLARCPGRIGEYLAITGNSVGAADAIASGLADVQVPAVRIGELTEAILRCRTADEIDAQARAMAAPPEPSRLIALQAEIDEHFSHGSLLEIVASLGRDDRPFARETHEAILQRSPLMACVALEQVRRGRGMTVAEDLRMERVLIHNCFHLRPGEASEAVEGIRALVVDKDRNPQWKPSRLEDVSAAAVQAYFASPWSDAAHPLAHLEG